MKYLKSIKHKKYHYQIIRLGYKHNIFIIPVNRAL